MIPSPSHSSRGGRSVRLVVIHTAEGARTVEELGNYFARAAVNASSHVGIDNERIETYVPYDREAWTIRSGNAISDNAELCGFARWTREEWLREHPSMLVLAARWIAERCKARGIPIKKLTPAEVRAGQSGVIGHVDWTLGMQDGTHVDPGAGFPWDVVIQAANELSLEGDMQLPTLREGDGVKGAGDRGRVHWYVMSLQALLNVRGLPKTGGLTCDGVFGPATTAAVKALQGRWKLTQDGVVGPETWRWAIGNDAPDYV